MRMRSLSVVWMAAAGAVISFSVAADDEDNSVTGVWYGVYTDYNDSRSRLPPPGPPSSIPSSRVQQQPTSSSGQAFALMSTSSRRPVLYMLELEARGADLAGSIRSATVPAPLPAQRRAMESLGVVTGRTPSTPPATPIAGSLQGKEIALQALAGEPIQVEGTLQRDDLRVTVDTGPTTHPVRLRRCVPPADAPVTQYCSADGIWQRYLAGEE